MADATETGANGARPFLPGDARYRQFGAHRVFLSVPPQPAIAEKTPEELQLIWDQLLLARELLNPSVVAAHPVYESFSVGLDLALMALYREICVRDDLERPGDVPPGLTENEIAGPESPTRDPETELERRSAWGDR